MIPQAIIVLHFLQFIVESATLENYIIIDIIIIIIDCYCYS